MPDSITCPRCGTTSHHPRDVADGYCGRCHWWTSDPTLASHMPADPERRLDITRGSDDT